MAKYNETEITLTATDRTKAAILSAKANLAGLAEAGQRAGGSLSSLLKLPVGMIALGAATAGVAAAMRSLYNNSDELQGATSKLGTAWDNLMTGLSKSSVVDGMARAIRGLADEINNLAPKNVTDTAQARVDDIGKKIIETRDKIATKSNYGAMAFWLPSVEDLHKELDALTALVVKKSEENNRYITNLRRQGLDPNEFKQLTDAEWQSIQFRSNKAFENMKKAEQHAQKVKEDFKKLFADSFGDEEKLALKYNEDVNKAIEYMQQQPKERKRVLDTLLRLEAQYIDDKAKLMQEGPAAPDGGQLEKNKQQLDFLLGDSRENLARERLAALQQSLLTEEQAIEASYNARLFTIEAAFQEGVIKTESEYNSLSTQAWAEMEAAKLRITADAIEQRKQLSDAEKQFVVANISGMFGSLATLADGHSKRAFRTSQMLAIAQATVDAYAGAVAAGKSAAGLGPAAAAAAYGSVLLKFLAAVKTIRSTRLGGGGTGGGGGDAGSGGVGNFGYQPQAPAQTVKQPEQTIVQVYVNGALTPAQLTDQYIIPIVQDRINNGSTVLARSNSRQALEIRGI